MRPCSCVVASVLLVLAAAEAASAQPDAGRTRYAAEVTEGLEAPTGPRAGEHDALAVSLNPAGLTFLRGLHLGALWREDDDAEATDAGAGWGMFAGVPLGGGLLPPMGLGIAVEALRPARSALAPDPGDATRLSLGWSLGLGRDAAVGVAWRRFYADDAEPLAGASSWDLGLSARLGPRLALGMVARDLARPRVAGERVQRRYEAELAARPLVTDRLELGLGGRVGESRGDVDGWLRGAWKVVRGVYLRGELDYRSLEAITASAGGPVEADTHELRALAGLELSFGRLGLAGYGALAVDDDGGTALQSGAIYARISAEVVPAVQGAPRRIEKLELAGEVGERALTKLVLRLRELGRDRELVAVFVQLDGLALGWAQAQELRSEIAMLRAAGKVVFAYLIAGSTRDYYVASAADQVYVDPAGGLWLNGFAATTFYFKGVFDKLGVEAQFEKIAEWKSAPEAYTLTEPSAPALANRDALYDDVFATLVAEIAASRKLAADQVRALIDGGPYTAGQLAAMPELVDAVLEPDALPEKVRAVLGDDYPVLAAPLTRPERWAIDAIAVIYLDGDIVTGPGQAIPIIDRRTVGGDDIVRAIAAARDDREIKAIVLRINSPGGSALASEIMAREVFKTRGEKPIICSLGEVAASGGYFAAAGCDTIVAAPTTITGSIGIFTGKFDLSGLMARLGLGWHTYRRGQFADRESLYRPYSDEERSRVKDQITYFYGRFLDYVARGRGLTPQAVDAVGRGRVWTGRQAREVALVDQLGGVADAIALARQRAGIDADTPLRLVELPAGAGGLLARLLALPLGGARAATALPAVLAPLVEALPGSLVAEPGAIQARLPFTIRWD